MLSHDTHRRSRGGFTLLEVLIAMAILSIAVIALANLFLLSIAKNGQAGEASKLASAAQDKMEELMALDWLDPALAADTPCSQGGNYCDRVTLDVGIARATGRQHFEREWEIINNAAEPNSKTINVTVFGADLGNNRGYMGRRQTVTISMVKSGPLGGAVYRN